MASKKKFNFYAVSKGYKKGIYSTWEDTDPQVNGFKGNRFKGYFDLKDAISAMQRAGIADPILYGPGLIQFSITNILDSSNNPRAECQISSQVFSLHNTPAVSSSEEDSFDEDITFKKMYVSESLPPNPDFDNSISQDSTYHTLDSPSNLRPGLALEDLTVRKIYVSQSLSTDLNNSTILDTDNHSLMTSSECDVSEMSLTDTDFLITPTAQQTQTIHNNTSISPSCLKPTSRSFGCQTETQFGVNTFDEILDRLNERDETIKSLSIQLESVKGQIKNEIKAQVKPSLEENKLNSNLLSEVKLSNEKLKGQLSDQKSMIKDLVKSCNSLETRSKIVQNELESLKSTIISLSSTLQNLDQSMSTTAHERFCNAHVKEPDSSSKNNSTLYKESAVDSENDVEIKTSDHINTNLYDDESIHEIPLPRQRLFSMDLSDKEFSNTDIFIIGDSQISLINPNKMSHPGKNESVTKISVPGITPEDLFLWLKRQSPQKYVREVIIHIGANSCLNHITVKKSHWDKIIRYTQKVFPNAHLIMSTIIPVGSKDCLYDLVLDSIENLKVVANYYNVTVIDHTDIFLTRSNAPILELFRKRLHPNLSGTIRMALNLKYPKDFITSSPYKANKDKDYQHEQYTCSKDVSPNRSSSSCSNINSIDTIHSPRSSRSRECMDSETNSQRQKAMETIQKVSELLFSLVK